MSNRTALLVASVLVLAVAAAGARAQSPETADAGSVPPSAPTAAALAGADGSGDGSGAPPGAAVDGSGDSLLGRSATAPDPLEVRAARASAEQVRATARALVPRPRDPRLALVRAGEATAELADVLGIPLVDLTDETALRARAAEFHQLEQTLAAELAGVRASYSAVVRLANRAYRSLRVGRQPNPVLSARVVGYRGIAASLAARAWELERDRALAGAAVELLNSRVELVRTAATADGITGQTAEIEAERQRLQQETAVTDAVANRARETQERARAEREAARSAAQAQIAARWEALAPRLDAIAAARTAEQEVIARLTSRREEFAANQIERSAGLETVLSEPDRTERQRRADAFIDQLIAERNEVRRSAAERRQALASIRSELDAAKSAVQQARRDLESGAFAPAGVAADTRVALREIAQEELNVLEDELGLAQLRFDNRESLWGLNEAQIHFYARTIDRVVPELSRERQRRLFAINSDNLKEVRRNLTERIVGLRLVVRDWFSEDDLVASEGGRVRELVRPTILLLALLVALRTLPRYRDHIIVRLIALRTQPRFRRMTPALLKLGEVIHESFAQVTAVAVAWAVYRVFDAYPMARMVAIWWFWLAVYRALLRIVRTMVLPRSVREPVMIGEPPDEVRLGVDTFDFTEARARLIVRSVKLVAGYVVVGRISLAAVRFLFGPGFFFYWTGWLYSAALVVLGYAIAWYWRKAILDEFEKRAGDRAKGFSAFLRRHIDKPYSVLAVFAIAVGLVAWWLIKFAAHWASGRGIGRVVANFAVRKKLERAAGDTESHIAIKNTVLPVAYQKVFRDQPVDDDALLVHREPGIRALSEAFEGWTHDEGMGTVAVVGDTGSGKTTYARLAVRTLEPQIGVASKILEARLLSPADVHRWFVEHLELGCEPSLDRIVETLRGGDRRVVIVDQCENLFLRRVGGFDGIDAFLDVCTLTNDRVFWVLVFDEYPWRYMTRVADRRGYFRTIVELRPFNEDQIRQLIEKRNEAVGVHPNFDRLTGEVAADEQHFELVKTAAGYFRLLAEYSRGNLRVAQYCWLRSLLKDEDGSIHVTLFARPDSRGLKSMSDDLLFALTSLVQHRSLSVAELAQTLDMSEPRCAVLVNLLQETGYIDDSGGGRWRLATSAYFNVLGRLKAENFLHLD